MRPSPSRRPARPPGHHTPLFTRVQLRTSAHRCTAAASPPSTTRKKTTASTAHSCRMSTRARAHPGRPLRAVSPVHPRLSSTLPTHPHAVSLTLCRTSARAGTRSPRPPSRCLARHTASGATPQRIPHAHHDTHRAARCQLQAPHLDCSLTTASVDTTPHRSLASNHVPAHRNVAALLARRLLSCNADCHFLIHILFVLFLLITIDGPIATTLKSGISVKKVKGWAY